MYSSLNISRTLKSRRMKWTGHLVRMGMMRNAYTNFVRKPEGKRPFGKSRRRLEDKIKTDPREILCEGVDWIHLARARDRWQVLVNTVMNLNVP
jgi:hypothetical protein